MKQNAGYVAHGIRTVSLVRALSVCCEPSSAGAATRAVPNTENCVLRADARLFGDGALPCLPTHGGERRLVTGSGSGPLVQTSPDAGAGGLLLGR